MKKNKFRNLFIIIFSVFFVLSVVPFQIQTVNATIYSHHYISGDETETYWFSPTIAYEDGFNLTIYLNFTTFQSFPEDNLGIYLKRSSDSVSAFYTQISDYEITISLNSDNIADNSSFDIDYSFNSFDVINYVFSYPNTLTVYINDLEMESIDLSISDDYWIKKYNLASIVLAPQNNPFEYWLSSFSSFTELYLITFSDECQINGDTYFEVYYNDLNYINKSLGIGSYGVPSGSTIVVYGVANEGYYFDGVAVDFVSEEDLEDSYSGYSFTVIDDCDVTVTFGEWIEEFDNEAYVAVSLDYSSSFMTAKFNGDTYYFGDWNNGEFEYYFSNFTVPYNTFVTIEYFDDEFRNFQFWYYNKTGYDSAEFFDFNLSPSVTSLDTNPYVISVWYEDNENYLIKSYITPSTVWVGGATPTPTSTTSGTATPTPSTTPTSYGYVTTIMEWLFGDDGLLGEGFGTLILIIAMILVIYFPQTRNVYGILLALTIVIILNIVTGLWEVWTVIILIIAWIAFIVTQTGILNRTGE